MSILKVVDMFLGDDFKTAEIGPPQFTESSMKYHVTLSHTRTIYTSYTSSLSSLSPFQKHGSLLSE